MSYTPITNIINNLSTNYQLPTALAVYDFVNSGLLFKDNFDGEINHIPITDNYLKEFICNLTRVCYPVTEEDIEYSEEHLPQYQNYVRGCEVNLPESCGANYATDVLKRLDSYLFGCILYTNVYNTQRTIRTETFTTRKGNSFISIAPIIPTDINQPERNDMRKNQLPEPGAKYCFFNESHIARNTDGSDWYYYYVDDYSPDFYWHKRLLPGHPLGTYSGLNDVFCHINDEILEYIIDAFFENDKCYAYAKSMVRYKKPKTESKLKQNSHYDSKQLSVLHKSLGHR